MDDHRIKGPWQERQSELDARREQLLLDDPDVADSDAGYLDGELDELYYGIASGGADPQIEELRLDELEGDDPDP